jgi:hypothetical protein
MRLKNFIQFLNESASMGSSELSSDAIKKFYKSGLEDGTLSVTKKEQINNLTEGYDIWQAFPMAAEYYTYSEGDSVPRDILKYNPYTGKKDKLNAEQQIRNFLNVLRSQGVLERYVANEKEIYKDAEGNASLFDIYVSTSGTGTPDQNSKLAKQRGEWVRETIIKLLQEIPFFEKSGYEERLTEATARSIVSRGKLEYIQNFNDQRYIYDLPESNLQSDRILSIVAYNWTLQHIEPIVVTPEKPNTDLSKIELAVQAAIDSLSGPGTNEDKLIDAIYSLNTLDEIRAFLDLYLRINSSPFFDDINGDNFAGENNQMVRQVSSHLNNKGYKNILKDVGSLFSVMNIIVQ